MVSQARDKSTPWGDVDLSSVSKRSSSQPESPRASSSVGLVKTMDDWRNWRKSSDVAKTAEEVLLQEETTRARGWAAILFILPTISLAFLPWLEGRDAIKVAYGLACSFYIVPAVFIFFRIANPKNYTAQLFRVWGYTAAFASSVTGYCLGLFSPTPLIATLGISFFGLGKDVKHAIMIPAFATSIYFVQCILVVTGVVPDYGLFHSSSQQPGMLFFFTFMVPVVLVCALWMARISRRALVRAVESAAEAHELVVQREAQLQEAELELEHALIAGAGIAGRYTGRLAGRYELELVIGRGGMGEVYSAKAIDTRQECAVKLLRNDVIYDDATYQRFLREGEIGESLKVSNVIKIYDVGRLADGAPFIAMELLQGEDLSSILRRERVLRIDQAVDLGFQVARGMSAAHEQGIVHRDLKPQNLFYHQEAPDLPMVWKILDFGVSRKSDAVNTLTNGEIIGTPAYMSPEQARGETVDHRSDIYSLGSVLYRALTGRQPFSGRSTMFAVVFQVPTQPSSLNSEVSPDLERVIAISMSKDPHARFQSANEMGLAIIEAAENRLSEEIRQHADELIEAAPWGSNLGDPTLYG
ncbi:MAG: serine/threonine-protein kinase [Myxococcota bacterium]|nr:serine/threonine-protein kinase [Myxococcota bacterium]